MSIEAQRRECLAFAEKQGWRVHKVYVDEARSGTSDDRAAFQEMIAESTVKHPPFQFVLVHKLDRFARNRYDSVKYKALLRRSGVRVVSATQPIIGSGDPTEVLLEAMLEGMDEFYSLNLARESLKGMAENARRGWWNGGFAPLGYKLITTQTEKGPKRKLAVETSEAKLVRRIFALYLKGDGVSAIRHRLNTEGLRCRGGYPFTKNLVLGILRNEKYCGDVTFGKRLNKRRRPMDWKLDAITIKDTHEPIASREDWNRVQTMLDGHRRVAPHPRASMSDYLFSGLIECALCGARFVGQSAHSKGHRYPYYVCNTIIRAGSAGCRQRRFNAETLERIFLSKLHERLTTRETIKKLITSRNELLKEAQAQRENRLPRLNQEIQALDRKRTRLFELAEENKGLTSEDIAPRVKELAALMRGKELDRDQLKVQLAAKPVKVSEPVIRELVDFYAALFADESFWGRKRLVHAFMVSVKIDDRYAYLTYDPSLTSERYRIPLGGDEDGGSANGSAEPPPQFRMKRKWLPGQDSNLRHAD